MLGVKELTPADKLRLRLRYHPIRVMAWLVILGITSAFLTLVFCYFATTAGTVWNAFRLPPIFHANTIIILASGYTVTQMRQAYRRHDHAAYRQALMITAGLGIAFTVFQVMGWTELLRQGIGFRGQIAGAYLYLISGLHLAHLLVGVIFLLYFLYRALVTDADAYAQLMFETDPVSGLRVEMLGIYWHFVDGLWLFLYGCFLLALYAMPHDAQGWYLRSF
ncbi:MAG: cytochrome c oxidase subunit 3 [Bacteroidetes bacterium]|nr:cytochrome c oxidase subunit 3 [Bacteroidota bacterium]